MNIFMDGRIISAADAVISPFDHGFLYGLGLFETLRTYQGRPALFSDHYRRLALAAEEIGIALTMSEAELENAIHTTMEANRLQDAYIRVDLTAGKGDIGPYAGVYESPSWLIFAKPLPVFPPDFYRTGKRLQVLQTRRNKPEGAWRFKSHHFMNNRLAKREIGSDPLAEGLFLTQKGFLAEGIVSNLFFVSQGALSTPAIETGILPGTRRAYVLEIAKEMGVRVEEGYYSLESLLAADEIFLTNAVQEIVPVNSVSYVTGHGQTKRQEIGRGTIGYHTDLFLNRYRRGILNK
ncbi:aminodeoxychorismate lyase [Aneurinibacillus sp. Ricciae_BoGa-3]|uniref:aminodeoxychorismate lyase n=1 Tax=Aneurinibacillus sp. Ricciae_BoGa-3 TaxID=3022697 RepID=UPI002340A3DE|nr:aminodeoxychorismate lyase [Aneurinibacillus sp. Ricciae_BoGa-3]WCK54649.1 aminodeoxychorismate lyase [Aneurinibacillus sp. Ricciae_BoGa-3]